MVRDAWIRLVLRPLGHILGTKRWEPHFVALERCLDCGYEGGCVIACSTPLYDPESDAIYGMECAECGAMACTTLGMNDGLSMTETLVWPPK